MFVKKDIKFGFVDGEAYLGNVPGLSDSIIYICLYLVRQGGDGCVCFYFFCFVKMPLSSLFYVNFIESVIPDINIIEF